MPLMVSLYMPISLRASVVMHTLTPSQSIIGYLIGNIFSFSAIQLYIVKVIYSTSVCPTVCGPPLDLHIFTSSCKSTSMVCQGK